MLTQKCDKIKPVYAVAQSYGMMLVKYVMQIIIFNEVSYSLPRY